MFRSDEFFFQEAVWVDLIVDSTRIKEKLQNGFEVCSDLGFERLNDREILLSSQVLDFAFFALVWFLSEFPSYFFFIEQFTFEADDIDFAGLIVVQKIIGWEKNHENFEIVILLQKLFRDALKIPLFFEDDLQNSWHRLFAHSA